MKLSIGEAAAICGVSVRTLRYYDEIGLVSPCELSESGYRFYDDERIALINQVLFYRELEFSLKEIIQILSNPEYDRKAALKNHRMLLLLKRKHIDDILRLLDETTGGNDMSKEKPATSLADIKEAKKKYADEVRERWGDTDAYRESQSHERTDEQQAAATEQADEIFAAFAACMDESPDSDKARALVRRWQEHITEYYYKCTDEILSCLADMYTGDERFRENIDRFGDGTAQFMSLAIKSAVAK